MAINFRMSYNDVTQYVDLFPRTDIKSIAGNSKLLAYSKIQVEVPPTKEFEQSIPISITDKQKNSVFYINLISSTTNSVRDYSTITNTRIAGNNLIINRTHNFPKDSIRIEITFLEGGV